MSEQFEGQHADEEVLVMFRRHPIVMRWGLIAILIGVLFGMIPSLLDPLNLKALLWVPAGMLLGGVYLFYTWIGWYFSVVIVTDQRLIQVTQKGFFNRTVSDIGLEKILSINYQIAGFQETIFAFGTILVQTFVGDMVIDKVHHPQDVQEKITKIIKERGFAEGSGMGIDERARH